MKKKFMMYGTFLLIVALLSFCLFQLLKNNMHPADPVEQAFQQAANETHVPVELLKAVAYNETRFDMHGVQGITTQPGDYGMMNLYSTGSAPASSRSTPSATSTPTITATSTPTPPGNTSMDLVGQAAKELGVSKLQVKTDTATNIRAGAVILKDDARLLSGNKKLPDSLAGWSGAVALYSRAQSRYAANLYVSDVYKALHDGFSVQTASGETIELAPQNVTEQPLTEDKLPSTLAKLPEGCKIDNNVDYPGAVDCILDPKSHDCTLVPGTNAPCNYLPANRPKSMTITQVIIHDTEGDISHDLSAFQNPRSIATPHYIVDSYGSVYQLVRENDVALQAGNLWYNQHSIGIEHEGFATSGNIWYTPAMYEASAKLTAYLVQQYHIPLDHDHILSHGTIQGPTLAYIPNHVDPGMYWQWDYYLGLVHRQGVPYPQEPGDENIIALHLPSNVPSVKSNFFYLYNSPKVDPHNRIAQAGPGSDVTDETNNVESTISYYYVDKKLDQNGSDDMMYEIWYGESTGVYQQPPSEFMHARLAWLAVPPGDAREGQGTAIELHGTNGQPVQISGSPKSNTSANNYHIGDAPDGAIFASAYKVTEDGTSHQWYEINYNHRQAWVPASVVQFVH